MITGAEKFWVSLVGVAVTACLGIIPPQSTLWTVLTVISAVATAALVYATPNTTTAQAAVDVVIGKHETPDTPVIPA